MILLLIILANLSKYRKGQVWPQQQASKTSRVARVQNDGCEQRAMESAGFADSKNCSALKMLVAAYVPKQ